MQENKKNTSDQQQNIGSKAGDYKNIETAVNNPSYFDNDYAAHQEDKITEKEHRTEDENQDEIGKS